MITAVDTNVLLEVFTADPRFGPRSREALRRCRAEGGLIACEIVWAELGGAFADGAAARLDVLRNPEGGHHVETPGS